MTKWKVAIKWNEKREAYVVDVYHKWFVFTIDIRRLILEGDVYSRGEAYDYYASFNSVESARIAVAVALQTYVTDKQVTKQKIKQEKHYSFKF